MTAEQKAFIHELGLLTLALLPYVVLGFLATTIRPDLFLLPFLPLLIGIAVNHFVASRFRVLTYTAAITCLALLAVGVWSPAAGGIFALAGGLRLLISAWKE